MVAPFRPPPGGAWRGVPVGRSLPVGARTGRRGSAARTPGPGTGSHGEENRLGFLDKLFGPRAPRVQPTHVDDGNFVAEVARSALPVVLDVWSPGCGPCKMMEPIVTSLATRYAGRVKVAELNAAE